MTGADLPPLAFVHGTEFDPALSRGVRVREGGVIAWRSHRRCPVRRSRCVGGQGIPVAGDAGSALRAAPVGGGVPGGVERGAREGERAAGPVGAIVGGTIGGVVVVVAGVLGVEQRPRFHRYVVDRHVPSYRYREEVRVGTVLPEQGVTYYEVPQEYGVRDYRYTVVNDRTVLVDPRTHRIVEIVE